MQAHLLVVPNLIARSRGFPLSIDAQNYVGLLLYARYSCHRNRWNRNHRSRPYRWVVTATDSASSSSTTSDQNHYAVLGVSQTANSSEIKRAYRLLARKFHPDVSKHAKAEELFKGVREAYEVLSNDASRALYDRTLKSLEYTRSHRTRRSNGTEFEDGRSYRWDELRWRRPHDRYYRFYKTYAKDEYYESCEDDEENVMGERESFAEVLRSALLSIILLKTFGSRVALTFNLLALFDKNLDFGYKIGYAIAWVLGGISGVLLTLCLSFASWVCGKASSSVVVLVVVAMWVGTNLTRYAPLPQGALLTLLYMSIKLKN